MIIGKIPREKDKQKSFELFRNSLKSVSIVTFDELLLKLESLVDLLRPLKAGPTNVIADHVATEPGGE